MPELFTAGGAGWERSPSPSVCWLVRSLCRFCLGNHIVEMSWVSLEDTKSQQAPVLQILTPVYLLFRRSPPFQYFHQTTDNEPGRTQMHTVYLARSTYRTDTVNTENWYTLCTESILMRLLPRCKLGLNKCLPTGLAVSQIPWSMLIGNNQQKDNRKILNVWKPCTALTTHR